MYNECVVCGQRLAPRKWWNPVSPIVHDTPSGDCPVLEAKREELRRLESEDAQDRYYLDLKGARESLCRAQTFAPSGDRLILQAALDNHQRGVRRRLRARHRHRVVLPGLGGLRPPQPRLLHRVRGVADAGRRRGAPHHPPRRRGQKDGSPAMTTTSPRVHLRLHMTANGEPYTCDWDYQTDHPAAVFLTVLDHRHQPPRVCPWVMARDLLSDALVGYAGAGDVRAWLRPNAELAVQLRGPDGKQLTLTGDAHEINHFLLRSYELLPSDAESGLIEGAVDDLLDELRVEAATTPPVPRRAPLRLVAVVLSLAALAGMATGGVLALVAASVAGWWS